MTSTNQEIAINICIVCLNINRAFPENTSEILKILYSGEEYEYGSISEATTRNVLVLINQQRKSLVKILKERVNL